MSTITRAAGFVLLFTTVSFAQTKTAADKWIGTWKMNPAKTKYQSGVMPKSRTLTFEAALGGVKVMSDLLDAIGAVHIEFSAKYDGKDVAMRGPNQGNTIAVLRTDAYTFETIQKSNGKVVTTTKFVVSRDGKALTASSSGLDDVGVKYTNVVVYDRLNAN